MTKRLKILTLIILGAIALFATQPAYAQTPISYGQTVSDSISAAAEKDEFTFSGANTDVITIRFAKTSGTLSPYVELFNPAGTRITYSSSGVINATLTSTGTFKISLRDYNNTNTGDYSLSLQRVNNPVAATTLNFGQTASGTIDSFAKIVTYSFSASANDKVYIRFAKLTQIQGTFDPYVELYDSTGSRLNYSSSGTLEATVTTAGNLSLLVTDSYRDGAGTYELTLQRPNNPANVKDINYGSIIEDSLDVLTGINVYRFAANTSDAITICSTVKTQTSGSFSLYLELYDTTGTRLAYGSGSLKYTFTTSGTFYLFITDSSRDGTGIYKFILLSGDVSCSTIDLVEPRVSLIKPKAGEIIESGSTYAITWSSSDNVGITFQEIRLSTDSGATYPTVIASGLDNTIQSYNWQIPQDLTTKARIRITAQDARGNIGRDENKSDFMIINTNLPLAAKAMDYEYDKLNRLTKSKPQYGLLAEYTYDTLGNRLNLSIQTLYTFQDVLPSYWAWKSIENVYYSGIASGCRYDSITGQRWYCPESNVTRAQMAVFLARALKLPDYTGAQIFSDVPPTYWAYKQIGAVYRAGITSGCNATQFCPDGIVNRAQMAVFLARALKLPDYTGPQIFSDVPTTYWAYKQIGAIYKAKITSGCAQNKFCPESNVTRAQMAVFLDNAFINKTY